MSSQRYKARKSCCGSRRVLSRFHPGICEIGVSETQFSTRGVFQIKFMSAVRSPCGSGPRRLMCGVFFGMFVGTARRGSAVNVSWRLTA